MYLHANAKLGLAGRFALVQAIEGGMSLKAAAAAFSDIPSSIALTSANRPDSPSFALACRYIRALLRA